MASDFWTRLLAPFPAEAVTWRILRLSEDGLRAEVRPRLRYHAVVERLNDVVGRRGWSTGYMPIGADALACTLTVEGVSKSVVVSLLSAERQDAPGRAETALVQAAEELGMLPPVDLSVSSWVDYNPEAGEILYEPAPAPQTPPAADTTPKAAVEEGKPAGQQAIDRLIERLRAEGLGLEAAKLVNQHGGYGSDPEAARELYTKLRTLLKEASPGS